MLYPHMYPDVSWCILMYPDQLQRITGPWHLGYKSAFRIHQDTSGYMYPRVDGRPSQDTSGYTRIHQDTRILRRRAGYARRPRIHLSPEPSNQDTAQNRIHFRIRTGYRQDTVSRHLAISSTGRLRIRPRYDDDTTGYDHDTVSRHETSGYTQDTLRIRILIAIARSAALPLASSL